MPYKDPKKEQACHRAMYKRDAEKQRARAKAYHHSHKEEHRAFSLKRYYGLTTHEYEALFLAQNGVCAICGKPPAPGSHLHVDHDHETNEIRGLLCKTCNSAIGYLKDSVDLLARAIQYLVEPVVRWPNKSTLKARKNAHPRLRAQGS